MEKVDVIGGISHEGEISILSSRFISTARVMEKTDEGYVIHLHARAHPKALRLLFEHRKWPIPRVLRLFFFMLSTMGKWPRRIICGMTAGFTCLFIALSIFAPDPPRMIKPPPSFIDQYPWVLGLITPAVFILFISRYVAPWHGAEHKAIAAYEKSGGYEMQEIRRANRVHPHCGGRMLLPLVLLPPLVDFFCQEILGFRSGWTPIITIEVALWVDQLHGLDRLPGLQQFSELLQRYCTTREPEELELQTAQIAMKGLVEIHRRADDEWG